MDWIKTNDQPLSKEDSNGERVIVEMYSSNKNCTQSNVVYCETLFSHVLREIK